MYKTNQKLYNFIPGEKFSRNENVWTSYYFLIRNFKILYDKTSYTDLTKKFNYNRKLRKLCIIFPVI
jgi:hypothetical protein